MWTKEDDKRFDTVALQVDWGGFVPESDSLFFREYVISHYPTLLAKQQTGFCLSHRDETIIRFFGRQKIWDSIALNNANMGLKFNEIMVGNHRTPSQLAAIVARDDKQPLKQRATLLKWAVDQSNTTTLMRILCDDFGPGVLKLSEVDNAWLLKKGASYAAKENKQSLLMPYLKRRLEEFHVLLGKNPSMYFIDDFFAVQAPQLGCKPAVRELVEPLILMLHAIFENHCVRFFAENEFVKIEHYTLELLIESIEPPSNTRPHTARKAIARFCDRCYEFLNDKFSLPVRERLSIDNRQRIDRAMSSAQILIEQINSFSPTP